MIFQAPLKFAKGKVIETTSSSNKLCTNVSLFRGGKPGPGKRYPTSNFTKRKKPVGIKPDGFAACGEAVWSCPDATIVAFWGSF